LVHAGKIGKAQAHQPCSESLSAELEGRLV
jgi:hypothetical protein